ncbi:hypothetical protein Nepgr_003985 [Nepenthes gracilis]|uniref:Uncharacterized protein n=1 Tax=Nepenthes gracilis TaxID=150966 RepID=A0AAD3XEQ9_NEPGR|nr:hypothetical protein Nepgr_003985 [Nepenthes gracilis]
MGIKTNNSNIKSSISNSFSTSYAPPGQNQLINSSNIHHLDSISSATRILIDRWPSSTKSQPLASGNTSHKHNSATAKYSIAHNITASCHIFWNCDSAHFSSELKYYCFSSTATSTVSKS